MENKDSPAMPLVLDIVVDAHGNKRVDDAHLGLTKREMIAMHVMQGFAATPDTNCASTITEQASMAVKWADALIDALETKNPA